MPYTLDEAAARLNLDRATLQFWEEALRPQLCNAQDAGGGPLFEELHIRALDQVRRWVLREKQSLATVRRNLPAFLDELRSGAASSGETAKTEEPSAQEPQVGRTGASHDENFKDETDLGSEAKAASDVRFVSEPNLPKDANPRNEVSPESVEAPGSSPDRSLERQIADLAEAVQYLAEENQALQELIGRLIRFVEALGSKESPAHGTSGTTGANRSNGAGGATVHTTQPNHRKSHMSLNGAGNEKGPLPAVRQRSTADVPRPGGTPRAIKPWSPRRLTPEEYAAVVRTAARSGRSRTPAYARLST